MSTEEGEEYEFHCAVCTGGVAESDFETGKAIRREGAVYCRKCFRQKFPDECEKHPGSKLTVLCAVCGKLNCPNCVIEIQGKKVCETCKPLALSRFEKGEEIGRVKYEPSPEEKKSDYSPEGKLSPIPALGVLLLGIAGAGMLLMVALVFKVSGSILLSSLPAIGCSVLMALTIRLSWTWQSEKRFKTLIDKFQALVGGTLAWLILFGYPLLVGFFHGQLALTWFPFCAGAIVVFCIFLQRDNREL